MNKKLVALFVAMVLCMSFTAAFAADSKTTNDVFSIDTDVIYVTQPNAETNVILSKIAELENSGASVAEYFGIAGKEGAADLKVDELIPIANLQGFDGDVEVQLNTAAAYTAEDKPVVMIGYLVNGEVVWTELDCEVVGGKLVVVFPAEILEALANNAANIAILSTK